jgi:hypothetical protein
MLNQALFISDAVVARQVMLPDGSEHELHFKQLPAAEFRRFFSATQSKDEDVQAGAMAKLIAASLCTPDGKPAITFKDALRLKPAAEKAISEALLAVNGMGDAAGNG